MFLLVIVLYYFSYNTSVNKPKNMQGDPIEFTVKSGDSVERIAKNLESMKIINSARYFRIFVWLEDLGTSLQAGTFMISPSMSLRDIVNTLATGDSVSRERIVKIIEGWNISDINEYLDNNDILENNQYLSKASQKIGEWQYNFEKPSFLAETPQSADLEGYLFPDTYKIFVDASTDDIIEKQLDNFGKKLSQELRDEIKKQGKSIHDIVTMASIIEKEVSQEKDRALVSGILYKRINIGMRLEVDSSINYITGKNDPAAASADLEVESPYNTYRNYGLPPGPICNPSLSAIKAAIYPEASNYLFYLNRQDTKETIFSKDYNEHLRNKAKYLK